MRSADGLQCVRLHVAPGQCCGAITVEAEGAPLVAVPLSERSKMSVSSYVPASRSAGDDAAHPFIDVSHHGGIHGRRDRRGPPGDRRRATPTRDSDGRSSRWRSSHPSRPARARTLGELPAVVIDEAELLHPRNVLPGVPASPASAGTLHQRSDQTCRRLNRKVRRRMSEIQKPRFPFPWA